MANVDKLAQLENVPLFRACSKAELKKIGKFMDDLRVPESHVLVRQGAVGREFFFILDGEVEVSRNGNTVTTLGPGDFFGELALLIREPRDATVTTVAPAHLLVIGQREFSSLMAESPTITHKLLEGMALRLRQMDSKSVSS